MYILPKKMKHIYRHRTTQLPHATPREPKEWRLVRMSVRKSVKTL